MCTTLQKLPSRYANITPNSILLKILDILSYWQHDSVKHKYILCANNNLTAAKVKLPPNDSVT
jgi:hypothetical protein